MTDKPVTDKPVTVTRCKHLSHTPEGICHGCGEQHEPLYSTAHAPSQPTAGNYLWSIASFVREKGCVRMELQLDDMGGYECRFHTAESLAAMPSQHSELADKFEQRIAGICSQSPLANTLPLVGHEIGEIIKALRQNPDTVRPLSYVEDEVRQHWGWGNLTRLGVCNMLVRGGFNQTVAIEKSTEICGPVKPSETADYADTVRRDAWEQATTRFLQIAAQTLAPDANYTGALAVHNIAAAIRTLAPKDAK